MANYSAIDPNVLKQGVNPADQNNAAIKAGYTGWSDYQDQQKRGSSSGGAMSTPVPQNSSISMGGGTPAGGGMGDLMARQAQQQSDFLNKYTSALKGQETSTAMSQRLGGELGIDPLRQNAQQLQTTLANIPQVQQTATRGYDVNQNQLSRIVAARQAQIAPSAQQAQQNLSSAEQQLNQRLQLGQQDQAKELQPLQLEQQMMNDRMSREQTGYSQGAQRELEVYLDQVRAGRELSAEQRARANQLADQETQFNQYKAKQDYDLQIEMKKQQQASQLQNQQMSNYGKYYSGGQTSPQTSSAGYQIMGVAPAYSKSFVGPLPVGATRA